MIILVTLSGIEHFSNQCNISAQICQTYRRYCFALSRVNISSTQPHSCDFSVVYYRNEACDDIAKVPWSVANHPSRELLNVLTNETLVPPCGRDLPWSFCRQTICVPLPSINSALAHVLSPSSVCVCARQEMMVNDTPGLRNTGVGVPSDHHTLDRS